MPQCDRQGASRRQRRHGAPVRGAHRQQIWLSLQAKWDLWHALRARGQRPKVKALPKTARRRSARLFRAPVACSQARGARLGSRPRFRTEQEGPFCFPCFASMRDAVATGHVRRSEFGWQLSSDQCLVGRIEWDPESDAHLPLVVIDGKAFSWETGGAYAHHLRGVHPRGAHQGHH
jgi:hypothetical protein